MENLLKGRYFTFFNVRSRETRILKYRSSDSEPFSANTIWESRILSQALYEVHSGSERIPRTGLPPFTESIRVLFLEAVSWEGRKNAFLVLNREFGRFEAHYAVLDSRDFICASDQVRFTQTMPYWESSFSVSHAGSYRVLFFLDGKYQFFLPLTVLKQDLARGECSFRHNGKSFFFQSPGLSGQDLSVRYRDLTSLLNAYDTADSVSEQEVEELYVPLNRIFRDIPDEGVVRYFRTRLEGNYNPAGVLKVLSLLKYMPDKEEVRFIQNLMADDRETALLLLEKVFDFDLLFLIREDQAREILSMVNDQDLSLALKGETRDRIGRLLGYLEDFRKKAVEAHFNSRESVEMEKVDEVQKRIGTFIRSYFQKKTGIPFVFEKKKITRSRIREFSVPYQGGAEWSVPSSLAPGLYLAEIRSSEGLFACPFKLPGPVKDAVLIQKWIYRTSDFISAAGMDGESVALKFNSDFSPAQIVIITAPDQFRVYDLSAVRADEIYRFPVPSGPYLRVLAAGLGRDRKKPAEEADLILESLRSKERFFLPDSFLPQEDFFIKRIRPDGNELVYVAQQEIPVSVNRTELKDLVEITGHGQLRFEAGGPPVSSVDVSGVEDLERIKGRLVNGAGRVLLVTEDSAEAHLLFGFTPVFPRFLNGILSLYNITDSPVQYAVEKDEEPLAEGVLEGSFLECPVPSFRKNLKISLKAAAGEFIYTFSFREEKSMDIKAEPLLKGKDLEEVLEKIRGKKARSLLDLILELKVYYFLFRASEGRSYYSLMRHVLDLIRSAYFRNRYFLYTPESEFSLMDQVEILLHLHEIFGKGLEELDAMIEKALSYLAKLKIRNKQLDIYGRRRKPG